MKNKAIYLANVIMLLFFVGDVSGQQLSQFSQYLLNPTILNPATTGVNKNINVKLSYRNQWTGFEDAPSTYYISFDAALVKPKKGTSLRSSRPGFTTVRSGQKRLDHGAGAYMVSDTYGAFTNTSGYITYALHLSLTKTLNMSLGIAGGLSGWKLDTKAIGVAESGDETYDYLMSQGMKRSFFDMNSGIWVFTNRFYVGYSSSQLLQNQIRDINIPATSKAHVHHFVTGGYKFIINDDMTITPSMMFKNMRPTPSTVDISAKVNYQEQIWGGLSYRTNDALVIFAGYTIIDKINVSYSYDVTLSDLNNYSSGSHEIVLGYMFYKPAQKSSVSFL